MATDLLIINTSTYFDPEAPRLLSYYLPPLSLMHLVSYLRAAVPDASLRVIDPDVHYTDVEAVRDVLRRVGVEPGAPEPLSPSQVRRASWAIKGHVADRRPAAVADLRATIRQAAPRVMAIPLCYSAAVWQTTRLLRIARAAAPDAVIVVGGNHASSAPDESMSEHPEIDLLVLGEGEVTLRRVVEAARQAGGAARFADIDGLVVRRAGGWSTVPRSSPPVELDSLPHPYLAADAFDLAKRRALFTLMPWVQPGYPTAPREDPAGVFLTARGCPFACTFCANERLYGRRVRQHSIEYVTEMVRYVVGRFSPWRGNIVDAMFVVDKRRTVALCEALAGLGLSWACQTRVDSLDAEVVGAMARMGMKSVALGVESFDAAVLSSTRKRSDPSKVARAVQLLHEHDIRAVGTFIVGLPGEGPAEVRRNAALARQAGFDDAAFFPLHAVPGSGLHERYVGGARLVSRLARGRHRHDPMYNLELSTPRLRLLAAEAQAIFTGQPLRWRALRLAKGTVAHVVYDLLPPSVASAIERGLRRSHVI